MRTNSKSRFLFCSLCLLVLALPAAAAPQSVGPGNGTVMTPRDQEPCGQPILSSDGTYENGYAWSHAGVAPPDYGAFANCFLGTREVCTLLFDLTQIGNFVNQSMDAYVWADDNGRPGAVLSLVTGHVPTSPPHWPSFSREMVNLGSSVVVFDTWWVGIWGNWAGEIHAWYLGADLNGPRDACPMTKIAPESVYPEGWAPVSTVWGETQAMGIGVMGRSLPPAEVGDEDRVATTWGRVKEHYR